MKYLLILPLVLLSMSLKAADTLKVLFIGNSYTYVNDLPAKISGLATAGGDVFEYQMSAPGGYTLEQHSTDATTLNYIMQGGWDYVVLQEQSQRPSFHDGQVAAQVYPYARKLDSLVHEYNPCGRTVFYMTWGRKNGDATNCAVWPPVCTYEGMDSLLQLRYTIMAEDNDAWLSPVSKVWRFLRNNSPAINLYQADESHPAPAGTYAAALSFYSLFFGKDPEQNSYTGGLDAATAATIRAAAKSVVYDSLEQYYNGFPPLKAGFNYTQNAGTYTFTSTTQGSVLGYEWDFGDGSPVSSQPSPQHTFTGQPPYNVCLQVYSACDTDRYCRVLDGTSGIGTPGVLSDIVLYPNPGRDQVMVQGLREAAIFRLYTPGGSLLQAGHLRPGQGRVALDHIPAGTYWLYIRSEKGSRTLKLVKE